MLDRNGNRIDRRNPQDIFVPLYNKQIPPGAGQVVHFAPGGPRGTTGPIDARGQGQLPQVRPDVYGLVFGKGKGPELPVVVMAKDRDAAPGRRRRPGRRTSPRRSSRHGSAGMTTASACCSKGPAKGGQKGELRQAEEVFRKVAELGRADGWVNLARVYQKEGRIPEALAALEKAAAHKEPPAPWVINWLTGQINVRNAMFDDGDPNFESVLETRVPQRKFDFSLDYEVINELASAVLAGDGSVVEPVSAPMRRDYLMKAIAAYRRTLAIDSEDVTAHFGLAQAYTTPRGAGYLSDADGG